MRSIRLALALFVSSVVPAVAGLVDTPVPVGTKLLYSVPGVMQTGNGLATFFSCTNADVLSATLGVEVFNSVGAQVGATFSSSSVTVGPGATVVFATNNAVGVSVDVNLNTASFSKGSARVVGTSSKFLCTAYVADFLNPLPTTSWELTIVAKTKQKAAN